MKKIVLLTVLAFCSQFIQAQGTCGAALPITSAGSFVIAAINGTQLASPICSPSSGAPTLTNWYAYTPTQNYNVTVTSDLNVNAGKDTRFHVYTGGCGALTCYSGDDDGGVVTQTSAGTGTGTTSYLSIATFVAMAGTTYYIAWDNYWSQSTPIGFTFQVIENTYTPPPPTPISYTSQTVATINSTYNICVVDMNGDHKDDIVGVSANTLKVHYQGAGGALSVGTFAITGTSDMPSWSLAAGDYNKDGFNDLLLGSGSGLTFWRSNNTGPSLAYVNDNPSQNIFCQRTNFIDINNDGNLDAFSCHDIAPNVYYMNNGSGVMTYAQSGTAGAYKLGLTAGGGNYASLWSDFDNDGDRDMFISKCSGPPCELHRNNGVVANNVDAFTDISVAAGISFQPVTSWSSAIADFDNDGDMDILIGSNGGTGHRFFKNNVIETGNLTFTNITAGSGFDTNTNTNRDYIAYDFDNNGFVDVMGGGGKILFNQGNGTFAPATYTNLSLGSVGDLNNDGFLDLQNGSTIRYAIPNGNNWLKLALQGVQSNGNGIGARVELYGAWGKQIRDVRSGEGFAYMSSLNVHFGLGLATAITKVIIRWPSGTIDTIYNPAINQQLLVVEGSTLALNLKLFVQGYYNGPGTMRSVKHNQDGIAPMTDVENITVELHNTAAPYQIIESTVTMLKTDGTAVCGFRTAPSGSYYIAVKTRSGVKTWSKTPQAIANVASTYDFTTAATKAYGDNMKNLGGGIYGIYSGDLNQDGNIDTIDYPLWEDDSNNFLSGIFATDLNGDGNVDTIDYPFLEDNSNNFVSLSDPLH